MKKTGFTLIEILVSISIIAILGTLIVQVFITTIRTNAKAELMKEIKQNGDYVLNTISRKVQNSSALDCGTGTSLVITNLELPPVNETIASALDPGLTYCRITLDGNYLTSDKIELNGTCTGNALSFVCSQISGKNASVTVKFTLKQKGSPPDAIDSATMSFQTTVQMRNIN